MTSELAAARLQECGRRVQLADAEQLEVWIFLGRELIEIQDSEAYRGEPINCSTWKEFLDDEERGFPKLTGLHSRTAYKFIDLARNPTLAAMTPAERADVARCGTATDVVRIDKAGGMTPEIRDQSQRLLREQFREATGASKGVVVTKWLADAAAGNALQSIVNFLAGASADVLGSFALHLSRPELQACCGGKPSHVVEFLISTIIQELADAEQLDVLRAQVFSEQGQRCCRCGEMKPLELHRIQYGSHGGQYVRSNIEGRCHDCHQALHDGRIGQAEAPPMVIQ